MLNFLKKKNQEIIQPSIQERIRIIEIMQKQLESNDELTDEEQKEIVAQMQHQARKVLEQGRDRIYSAAKYAAVAVLIIALVIGAAYVYASSEDSDEENPDEDSGLSEEETE